jgi:pyruvate,water dikinase
MTARPVPLTDPLHFVSPPGTAWTRVNMAEGLPGVLTPLSWSFWDESLEEMILKSMVAIGVLSHANVPPAERVSERATIIFYGRTALNIDLFRGFANSQPWISGDAVEQHFFGSVSPERKSKKNRRRYPIVIAKTIPAAFRVPGRIHRDYTKTKQWWQSSVSPEVRADVAGARARLVEAHDRFRMTGLPHSTTAQIVGALSQQLALLCARAGRSELFMTLLGGYESIEEETTTDLWSVARGELPIAEFLRRHGFEGPNQGEISATVWRDDPSPIERLATTFKQLGDDMHPRRVAERRGALRDQAQRELLAGLRVQWRPWARVVLAGLRHHIPCREIGKAALMMELDGARAAARTIGTDLAARGILDAREDVFYLTMDEVVGTLPANVKDVVAFRRDRRREYQKFNLPDSWIGNPEPTTDAALGTALSGGIGVSPGVVEGHARVITDVHANEDLEPGEILVCETTDPSWAAYFLVASGVVIDIGGAMSHGAIVAREVGIPCVVNLKVATRVLHTGDRVRIDGGTGSVELLERV